MKQEYSAEITVKSYYSENSVDIAEILERSVLLFIESEVKKTMQPGLLILLPKKTYNIFALPF